MTAALRRGPTKAHGDPTDGDTVTTRLDTEIQNLWKGVTCELTNVAGTANDITADTDHTVAAAITAYAKPMRFNLTPGSPNTTACTINIDTVGIINLKDRFGAALQGGELSTSGRYPLSFDGTSMRAENVTAGSAASVASAPDMIVEDRKADTTDAGTFTSAAWRQRDLNTAVRNVLSGASVSSNTIILQAGTYYIEFGAPAYGVNANQTRLYNATDSSVIAYGDTTSGASNSYSGGCTMLTIGSQKTIRLEHRCATTNSGDGYGQAAGFGNIEVYSRVKIWKQ